MGVYIKGITLSELNDCIMRGSYIKETDVVEVTEPHGRLIDADIVEKQLKQIEEITRLSHIELGEDPEIGEISMPMFTIRNIHKRARTAIEAEGE